MQKGAAGQRRHGPHFQGPGVQQPHHFLAAVHPFPGVAQALHDHAGKGRPHRAAPDAVLNLAQPGLGGSEAGGLGIQLRAALIQQRLRRVVVPGQALQAPHLPFEKGPARLHLVDLRRQFVVAQLQGLVIEARHRLAGLDGLAHLGDPHQAPPHLGRHPRIVAADDIGAHPHPGRQLAQLCLNRHHRRRRRTGGAGGMGQGGEPESGQEEKDAAHRTRKG